MRANKGFSMVEIALVLSIILILSAITVPRYRSTLDEAKIDTATERVVNAMRFARQMAVTTRDNIHVVALTTRICVYNATDADTLSRFLLPGGTSVDVTTGTREFHPRGTCIGGSITVKNDAGTARKITVNSVGRIKIEDA